jgi:hypothetical protein
VLLQLNKLQNAVIVAPYVTNSSSVEQNLIPSFLVTTWNLNPTIIQKFNDTHIYRVSQEEISIFWEVILLVIVSKSVYLLVSSSEQYQI